jgi:hypothetical protein
MGGAGPYNRLARGGAVKKNMLARQEGGSVFLVACPECGAPAEIEWRSALDSTAGPVETAKVLCVDRHWFLMPAAGLTPL